MRQYSTGYYTKLPELSTKLEFFVGILPNQLLLQVQQALTVTQNKLGDLWYRVGNLDAAREFYKRALAVRRSQAESAAESEKQRAELDLALSFAKLADISAVSLDYEL